MRFDCQPSDYRVTQACGVNAFMQIAGNNNSPTPVMSMRCGCPARMWAQYSGRLRSRNTVHRSWSLFPAEQHTPQCCHSGNAAWLSPLVRPGNALPAAAV